MTLVNFNNAPLWNLWSVLIWGAQKRAKNPDTNSTEPVENWDILIVLKKSFKTWDKGLKPGAVPDTLGHLVTRL